MSAENKITVLCGMSGTSSDGLDLALVEYHKEQLCKPLLHLSFSMPAKLKQRICEIQKPKTMVSLETLLELQKDYSNFVATSCKKVLSKTKYTPDLIALHGQTVFHRAPQKKKNGLTLQLLDPALVTKETQITVCSEFRSGDLSVGGNGAPLVPKFHEYLLQHLSLPSVAFHNLGGISNLSYFYPKKKIQLGFDTGPANLWIDQATERFTKGSKKFDSFGIYAKKGSPKLNVIEKLLKHPYFSKSAPKSTGRDDFPFELFKKAYGKIDLNAITTATYFTALTIFQSYEKEIFHKNFPLKKIYFFGGGVKNHFLMDCIRSLLPSSVEVTTTDELDLNSSYHEAQAFSYLAYLSLQGLALGGAWTGSNPKLFSAPASFTPGKNWIALLDKLQRV